MTRDLIIQYEAEAEIVEAMAWYEGQSYGRGVEFLNAAHACIAKVFLAPQRFPRVLEELRRALLIGFPYVVYFYFDDEEVTVVACWHQRRDPRSLARRL